MSKTRLEQCRDLIKNNPSKTATELYNEAKTNKFGIRKTDFLKEVREIRSLPEPTYEKRVKSIPVKYKTPITVKKIKKKIPFEKTKFGKIVKALEKKHGISEKKATERARALLKIPKKDYKYLNRKDVEILTYYTP